MKEKSYCLCRNCCCCVVTNEFHACAARLLDSVTESIVRLKVLKFSAAAFIALTVSWLLIRNALTMLSVISFDRFTNSSVYCKLETDCAYCGWAFVNSSNILMQFCVAVSYTFVTSVDPVEVFTLSLDLVSTILFHLVLLHSAIYTLVSNGIRYHLKPLDSFRDVY